MPARDVPIRKSVPPLPSVQILLKPTSLGKVLLSSSGSVNPPPSLSLALSFPITMASLTSLSITILSLDPRQPYGGQIDYSQLTLREATEDEATSLSPSTPNSIVLYESYINSGLHLPLPPLITGILSWFDISPSQVNANFYRAVSVASVAIPHLREDLVLTPELFLNCYKLGRRSEDTVLGMLVLVPRSYVAAPGGRLPICASSWQLRPFVAMGRWLESDGTQIRTAPNRNVDFKKPPPPLSSKDAVAFHMLQEGGNPEFVKFLRTAHQRKEITVRGSSSPLPNNVTKEEMTYSMKKPVRNHDRGDIPSSSKQNSSEKMNVIEIDSSTSSDDEAINLIATGVKRLRKSQEEMRIAKGYKEENLHLKAEMVMLKEQCSKLETKVNSDAQLANCLLAEKDELSQRLEATLSERNLASARQKELERELGESKELLRTYHATIRTLEESITNAQKVLKISNVSLAGSS